MGFEQDKYSPETKMFDEQNLQKERIVFQFHQFAVVLFYC